MNRSRMMEVVVAILNKAGFTTSRMVQPGKNVYDLISRRDEDLLLLKTLISPNGIDRPGSNELKVLGTTLSAAPILIIPSSKSGQYQDGVLYLRYGITLITLGTFYQYLAEEVPPLVFFIHGGHCVAINGGLMRFRRESLDLSLGTMAGIAGVSRKAIQLYEGGMGCDIDVALRLERALGVALISPLDPFRYSTSLQQIRDRLDLLDGNKREILEHLKALGMEVIPTISCPFDALARKGSSLLLTSVGSGPDISGRGKALADISRVTGKDSVLIVRGSPKKLNVEGTPVLGVRELKRYPDLEAVLELIRERA